MSDLISLPRAVLRHVPPEKLVELCDPKKLGRLLADMTDEDLADLMAREETIEPGQIVGVMSAAKRPLAGIDIARALRADVDDVMPALRQLETSGLAKREGVMWSLVGLGAPKAKAPAKAVQVKSPRAPRSKSVEIDDDQRAMVRKAFGTEVRTIPELVKETQLKTSVVDAVLGELLADADVVPAGKKGRSLTYRLRAPVPAEPKATNGKAQPGLFEGAPAT